MSEKFYQMTPRITRLKQMLNDEVPALSAERAKLATEAIELYAAEPPVLQKAHMLDYILRRMTIFIQDGELIVGNQGETPRCAPLFPEYTSEWILREIDDFETRPSDPMRVSAKDRKLVEEYLPKWKNKSFDHFTEQELPYDIKHAEECGILTVGGRDCNTGHILPDYFNILKRGFAYYRKECEDQIASTLIDCKEKQEQVDFWNACIISIDAAVAFAQRYSELAKDMAAKETDPARKEELMTIADICHHIPLNPARTFQEAVQFTWFIHLIINIESNGHGHSLHRFDQYTNDFYEADLKAGRVTEERAVEIIECFFIKLTSVMKLRDKFYSQSFAGYPLWQNMLIGGQKPEDGSDATNPVSVLCLKANQAVQTSQPSMSIQWHDTLSPELMREGIRMIQAGMATPAFFNNNLVVPMLQKKSGCTIEEARNWGIHGCVQPGVAGKNDGRPTSGYLNMLKIFELVMHNGVNPINGEQMGPKTGELEELDTLEKLQQAMYTQIDYFTQMVVKGFNIVCSLQSTRMPTAFSSLVVDNCIEKGKPLQDGGSKYFEVSAFTVAIGNTADCIAAVDTLVNKEHLIDIPTLRKALDANFEGYEDIRQMCLKKAPKYGNDDAYVDAIAAGIVRHYGQELAKYKDSRGGFYGEEVESQSMNVSQGKCVLATPDGRFAYEAVNDNCSPVMGRDVHGPTSCIMSVAHLDQKNAVDGCLYNLRFDPRSIQGEKGIAVVSSIIKTFFKNMGEHIQINVVDDKTLRDAQKHPENYRNLLVRVAGYLAYFVELDSEVQEAVIERTTHTPDC